MPERLRNTKDFFKNALSSASFEFAFNPFKQQANFTTKKYENEIVHQYTVQGFELTTS